MSAWSSPVVMSPCPISRPKRVPRTKSSSKWRVLVAGELGIGADGGGGDGRHAARLLADFNPHPCRSTPRLRTHCLIL